MKKKIGTIISTISILIGVFIVPINAAVYPVPAPLFSVDGNLLTNSSGNSSNCTVIYNDTNDRLELTTSGNGQSCQYFINAGTQSLALNAGRYSFGLLYSTDSNDNRLRLVINSNGSETIETTSEDVFVLENPSLLQAIIIIPASVNDSVKTISLRPYLIYDNDSVGELLNAVQSTITVPFTAVAKGFTSVADSIFGVDGKLTGFGVILVFVFTSSIVVWGISLIFDFLRRPLKRR